MKIIIMGYDKDSWYKDKLGKTYKVQAIRNGNYMIKGGIVNKKHVEVF